MPHWCGTNGTTTADCSSRSVMTHPQKSKRRTIANRKSRKWWQDTRTIVTRKQGAVQYRAITNKMEKKPRLFEAGPYVKIAPGKQGVVHSVFENSCNIEIYGNQLLLPLIYKKYALQPHAISVELPENTKINNWFTRGDKVTVSRKIIYIGNYELSWPEKRAGIDGYVIKETGTQSTKYIKKWSRETIKKITEYARARPKEEINCQHEKVKLIVRRCLEALLDKTSEATQCIRLIGLGAGLTPSGDDFICGLLAVANKYEPEIYSKLKKTISQEITRTTRVSRDYLMLAMEGTYSPLIITLVNAIENQNEQEISDAQEKLMRHGSSSGMDTLAGMAQGIAAIIKKKRK